MALPLVREEDDLQTMPRTVALSVDFPEPDELVAESLAGCVLSGWLLERSDIWTYLHPPVEERRVQGWKLHVSATVLSAPWVLQACLPILLASSAQFKFASTSAGVLKLNDFRCPRGNSGKFITVYPPDRDSLLELAEKLHDATAGLSGPAILSDARYRPGSLVHYRYGAFDGYRTLTHDGGYRDCVLDENGAPVEDRRQGFFQVPSWLPDPFGREDNAPAASVLLRDRYEVTRVVRHANKGGVYRALDRETGREVIVKEARPHVGTDREGLDARDYLRHEGFVLRHLAGTGLVPEYLDLFEQQEHVFLVEEFLDGVGFRERVDGILRNGKGQLDPAESAALAGKLARLLRGLHRRGVVVRDFTPNNLLAMPDGSVRLIDLELAAVRAGTPAEWVVLGAGSGTPGLSAPEQFACADPDPSVDLFSLGATLLHQIAHVNPDFAEDLPEVRPLEERVAEWLAPPLSRPVSRTLSRVIKGLMRTDPAERMPLAEVVELTESPAPALTGSRELLWAPEQWDELVEGALGHLVDTAAGEPAPRPWPETGFGELNEPCSVQHGLAGTLAVLAKLSENGTHVEQLYDIVLSRILGHLDGQHHRLPGLYFGFSGTAWALYDAGRALGRPDLTDRALRLVKSLIMAWPNPDVTHGLSGLGTCFLYLAGETGDAELARRAVHCAESVLAAANPGPDGLLWTIPMSFDSDLAGYRSYGFAHGVAGIGAFLLAAAGAAGREDFADAARRCGDTLLTASSVDAGAVHWPDCPGASRAPVWWCNGSAGIGTFLCRLYSETGDERYLEASIGAARAVMATRQWAGTAYCHGLPGNGDFLLDLAGATGDPTYRAWAESIAQLMWARRIYRNGRAVLPDEGGKDVTSGYGAGISGQLAFLTRLRFGGRRLFHPDPSAWRDGLSPERSGTHSERR